jgi:hypothetical protein
LNFSKVLYFLKFMASFFKVEAYLLFEHIFISIVTLSIGLKETT